jgi:hypothetical protein
MGFGMATNRSMLNATLIGSAQVTSLLLRGHDEVHPACRAAPTGPKRKRSPGCRPRSATDHSYSYLVTQSTHGTFTLSAMFMVFISNSLHFKYLIRLQVKQLRGLACMFLHAHYGFAMSTSCALHDATPLVPCLTAMDRGSCHHTSNFIKSTSIQHHNDRIVTEEKSTQGSRTFHFIIRMCFNRSASALNYFIIAARPV